MRLDRAPGAGDEGADGAGGSRERNDNPETTDMASAIRQQTADDYDEDDARMSDHNDGPRAPSTLTSLKRILTDAGFPFATPAEYDALAAQPAEPADDVNALRALYHRACEDRDNARQDASDAHAYADVLEEEHAAYKARATASIERLATALKAVSQGSYTVDGLHIADEALAALRRERLIQAALDDVERWAGRVNRGNAA